MSYRNRCTILGANGLINLTVPIDGGRNSGQMIRDIKIDNLQKWQVNHWRAIECAYNHSPWFQFYKDEMMKFYTKKYDFLWDWNIDLLTWTFEKLRVPVKFGFTEMYVKDYPAGQVLDVRNKILPRNLADFSGQCPVYKQVFQERMGFMPNLSIIDLLFCEGKNAVSLLKG